MKAGGPLGGSGAQRALQAGQRLVRRGRLELALVEAGARARVARGAGGLDEREQRVAVAVQAQREDLLHVAARRALVPQLPAAPAPEVRLPRRQRQPQRLRVHPRDHQHLTCRRVLHHRRNQLALVPTYVSE